MRQLSPLNHNHSQRNRQESQIEAAYRGDSSAASRRNLVLLPSRRTYVSSAEGQP